MSMVFDRYPNGGGEMILALALADHAHDDGTSVYPSIESLMEKTRQSRRTVQYQLRRMEEMGWLILVNSGNGGRNQHREYAINPDWIKGADIAPLEKGAIHDTKGANDDIKGRNSRQERVQPVAPAYNRHRTIIEPSIEPTLSSKLDSESDSKPESERAVCKRVIDYLNLKTKSSFKPTGAHARLIAARLKDGATEQELCQVIDRKCDEWLHKPDMRQYLRPNTLFRPKNYDSYVGQLGQPLPADSKGSVKHNNFAKQDYNAGVDEHGYF